MAFTDHCDVFGSVHEDGVNLVSHHVRRQRPSLFNYGTRLFADNLELLCRPIDFHPEVDRRGNPLLSVEDPLPIPGTDNRYGLDFSFQVTKLDIDFHPGNQFALPPELDPLADQRLALHVEVCGAIACPDPEMVERLADSLAASKKDERRPIEVIPGGKPQCFCIQLFATARLELVGRDTSKKLAIRLEKVEIVDIRPDGLEDSLECFIENTLRLGILPKLRVALDKLTFDIGELAAVTLKPTPISADVPNNPAIEEDQVKVFVNVEVS